MSNDYEESILARHSTPGLRRRELDRTAKKDHLQGFLGRSYPPEDIEKILDKIYPAKP